MTHFLGFPKVTSRYLQSTKKNNTKVNIKHIGHLVAESVTNLSVFSWYHTAKPLRGSTQFQAPAEPPRSLVASSESVLWPSPAITGLCLPLDTARPTLQASCLQESIGLLKKHLPWAQKPLLGGFVPLCLNQELWALSTVMHLKLSKNQILSREKLRENIFFCIIGPFKLCFLIISQLSICTVLV